MFRHTSQAASCVPLQTFSTAETLQKCFTTLQQGLALVQAWIATAAACDGGVHLLQPMLLHNAVPRCHFLPPAPVLLCTVRSDVDPEQAVALGAAIQAAVLQGLSSGVELMDGSYVEEFHNRSTGF